MASFCLFVYAFLAFCLRICLRSWGRLSLYNQSESVTAAATASTSIRRNNAFVQHVPCWYFLNQIVQTYNGIQPILQTGVVDELHFGNSRLGGS